MNALDSLENEVNRFRDNLEHSNEVVEALNHAIDELKLQNQTIQRLEKIYPEKVAEGATAEYVNRVEMLQKEQERQIEEVKKQIQLLSQQYESQVKCLSERIDLLNAIGATQNSNMESFINRIMELKQSIEWDYKDISKTTREEIAKEIKEYPYQNKQYVDSMIESLDIMSQNVVSSAEKLYTIIDKIEELSKSTAEFDKVCKAVKYGDSKKLIPLYIFTGVVALVSLITLFV